MPDKYDPYREALVVETNTIWPDTLVELGPDDRHRIETAVHADPSACSHLEYIRVHTGFCRQITVSPEDVERVQAEGEREGERK